MDKAKLTREQADDEIEALTDCILALLNEKLISRQLFAADSVYIAGSALAKCMAIVIFDQLPRAAFDKAERVIESAAKIFREYARAIVSARAEVEPLESANGSSPWDQQLEEGVKRYE